MIYFLNKKTLQYKKINGWFYAALAHIAIMSFVAGFVVERGEIKKDKKILSYEEKVLIMKAGDKFSTKKFVKYLSELNLKFPELVYAQSKTECGFNSPIFKENNNLFGMKLANIRPTCNIGENRQHAAYRQWRESVQDYAYYQAYFLNNIHTKKDYVNALVELKYMDVSKDSLYRAQLSECQNEYFSLVKEMKELGEWDIDSYSIGELEATEQTVSK